MQFLTRIIFPIQSQINHVRSIATSQKLLKIFTVQSLEEFDSKVKQSDSPVIVDFFAT